ncbi:hypothetical protein [Gorillibacterium sp. CAU 1737]|uniref:hypothetical protein n=1 Tax=Gorillibacterium sp. CAU 1737 TaxID=3140362 RepID=UPI0032607BF5
MLNYGEEIVYWYLRFNGFFIIDNFVLHSSPTGTERTSDSDLLAIRLPYVYEEVGGQTNDWDDHNIFKNLDINKRIAVICEVKTGGFDANRIYRRRHLEKAIARFGISPNYMDYVSQIENNPVTQIEDFLVAKILFSREQESPRQDCLHIRLDEVSKFIKKRLRKFNNRKYNDRMFFPSSLIQYMAWEEQKNL